MLLCPAPTASPGSPCPRRSGLHGLWPHLGVNPGPCPASQLCDPWQVLRLSVPLVFIWRSRHQYHFNSHGHCAVGGRQYLRSAGPCQALQKDSMPGGCHHCNPLPSPRSVLLILLRFQFMSVPTLLEPQIHPRLFPKLFLLLSEAPVCHIFKIKSCSIYPGISVFLLVLMITEARLYPASAARPCAQSPCAFSIRSSQLPYVWADLSPSQRKALSQRRSALRAGVPGEATELCL